MRKIFRKITALMLAIVLLSSVCVLSSCSNTGDTMLKLGKAEITENMFVLWLSRYKATFEQYYASSVKSAYGVSSVDAFWELTHKLDDGTTETFDDTFTDYIYQNSLTYLVALHLFNEYGLELSESALIDIEETITELRENYADGSKNEFNAILAEYGINSDTLEACYEIEEKIQVLEDYLFSSGGPLELTDETVEEYYQKTYVRMDQICIFLDECPETGDDGKYITGSDGNISYREMSAAETTLARSRADGALAKINAGADFDTVKQEYNENTESESYTEGIYLSSDNAYNSDDTSEIYDALCEMEEGEVRLVELEHTLHIIRKLPLIEGAWSKEANSDFFYYYDSSSQTYVQYSAYIKTPLFLDFIEEKIKEYLNDIEVDEEVRSRNKISTVEANYNF